MVNFVEFLKTWSLQSNSVTYKSILIGQKMVENAKIQMRHYEYFSSTVWSVKVLNLSFSLRNANNFWITFPEFSKILEFLFVKHSFLAIFIHCEAIKVTWCICQPSFYWWWSRDFLPHFICSGTISKALGIVVVGFFLSSSKAASGSDFKDLVFFETLWGQPTLKMNQQLALVMVL